MSVKAVCVLKGDGAVNGTVHLTEEVLVHAETVSRHLVHGTHILPRSQSEIYLWMTASIIGCIGLQSVKYERLHSLLWGVFHNWTKPWSNIYIYISSYTKLIRVTCTAILLFPEKRKFSGILCFHQQRSSPAPSAATSQFRCHASQYILKDLNYVLQTWHMHYSFKYVGQVW